MNPTIRNILAVIAGVIVGMVLNGFLITISSSIIAPPEGADVTTLEGLKASLHLFEPRHFIVPFLAHSLGTFVGAILAAALAATNKMRQALIVGILFLIGGITNVILLPAPMWYNVVDLVGAYLPFAYVGGLLGTRRSLA